MRVRILFPEKERIEKKPTESVEAHTLYLKGVYHVNKWTTSAWDRAIEYFKLACEQDPTFALAYARGLPNATSSLQTWGCLQARPFARASQNVTLPSGNFTNITFTWNTTVSRTATTL